MDVRTSLHSICFSFTLKRLGFYLSHLPPFCSCLYRLFSVVGLLCTTQYWHTCLCHCVCPLICFFCWLFLGLFGLYHFCIWCHWFMCLSVHHPCWPYPGLSSNFHWFWYFVWVTSHSHDGFIQNSVVILITHVFLMPVFCFHSSVIHSWYVSCYHF